MNQLFVIIGRGRYSITPLPVARWEIFEAARKTPKRYYRFPAGHPDAGSYRDTRYDIKTVLREFTSRADAEAFIAAAQSFTFTEQVAYDAAIAAESVAYDNRRAAETARTEALKAFLS